LTELSFQGHLDKIRTDLLTLFSFFLSFFLSFILSFFHSLSDSVRIFSPVDRSGSN
jgi:hypothetical protein